MATTMHFGPEWMRTKHQLPSRSQPPPSPPPLASAPVLGASTYSALVSPAPPLHPEKRDEAHPFRYSKEEMLRIYREGGGKGGLGLEVERWEGVVREVGSEPVGLREMGDAEKKQLFASPLNSDLRRRQSTDYLSPLSTQTLGTERPRLNHNNAVSGAGSPMRERFGAVMGRRRDNADPPLLTMPRKLSLSTGQAPLTSPRDIGLPSPRTRVGLTPTFDGVLNGGESWVARRRTSEGLLRAGGSGTSRDLGGECQQDGKGSEIREEEEENGHVVERKGEVHDKPSAHQPSQSPRPDTSPSGGDASKESIPPENLTRNMGLAHLSLTGNCPRVDSLTSGSVVGSPLGLPDLASVEWSYLDPQGQVQGPFRADLIQKWYDDGYFAVDLLMKRTHVDSEWLEVGELARRSGSDKIFLSPPVPSLPPPGLSQPTESPLQGFTLPADQSSFNGPYQPAPVRSLRSSTLDSYLGTGSNPSDSPSSSFSGGRFGTGSPDPAAFDGRAGINSYSIRDPSVGGRVGGFGTAPEPPSAFSGIRRNTFADPSLEPSLRAPSFGNTVPGRESTVDNYLFNGAYSSTQGSWQAPPNNPISSGFDALNEERGSADSTSFSVNFGPGSNMGSAAGGPATGFSIIPVQDVSFNNNGPGNTPFLVSDYINMGELGNHQSMTFGSPSQGQQHSQSPSAQYATPQQQLPVPALSNVFGHHAAAPKPILPNPQFAHHNPNLTATTPHSPWNNIPESTTVRRPGPFEAAHPTSTNTNKMTNGPVTPSQSSPWAPTSQVSRSGPLSNEPSPWFVASQGVVDENWKEEPGPDSLTFSNVGQHNQQQQQLVTPVETSSNVPDISDQSRQQQQTVPEPVPPPEVTPNVVTAPPAKARTKSTAQAGQKQVSALKSAPSPPQTVETPPPPSAHPKPAWSNEDEVKKPKPAGISLSLREIQEAEAKKSEVRKVAERERERTARASATVTEDVQSFTASWGLPTSQAGTRTNNSSSQKDVTTGNSTSSAVSTPPVWTTSSKPSATKKTMKEIQEEEERRKKLASKETAAAAAARRAYAETTNKNHQPVQNSAWTTVGPSGKTATVVGPHGRPSIASSPSTSGPHSTSRMNGSNVPRPTAVAVVAKAVPAAVRVDDHPAPPSHDFLKWLSDSLKGLNNSVNVEEIMSMLLSFPIDPDSSTVELISDLIYANSTTLDGRRFAAEFVSRRKTDATSRPKGVGMSGTTAGKPISIADVVKAQPKPAQPEWGGFKMVNKKKRGGKA